MSIEITIVKAPQNVHNNVVSHIFTEQGGTIGRGDDNTWVVDDPERFISSKHSEITFENGQYFLVDLSTNGTFLNGSSEPIGNGNRVQIQDGDRFVLDEYEFLISMQRNNAVDSVMQDDNFADSPFENIPSNNNSSFGNIDRIFENQDDPFTPTYPAGGSVVEPVISAGYEETDPLAALDKAAGYNNDPFSSDNSFHASYGDNVDTMQQAIDWPNALPESEPYQANGAIPEDWDNDFTESSVVAAPPRQKVTTHNISERRKRTAPDPNLMERIHIAEHKCESLEAENEQLISDIVHLKQQIKKLKNSPSKKTNIRYNTVIDETLIDSMGLGNININSEKKQEISAAVGEIMREMVMGLMQALTFRKKIKEEFRINVTTIQPVENNPLKFSANLDDAMENMFVKDNKAYQKPLDAVRESFQGISEHQVAVLAGIQAAFRGMIERLDPDALEKRFEKYRKTGVIKMGAKGKNWDAYREFHQDLVNNIDNSFQHLFGYDFVQAYEDQLQRLLMARKSRSVTNN